MEKSKELSDKINKLGFPNLCEFVNANQHYLSKESQKLFNRVNSLEANCHQSSYSNNNQKRRMTNDYHLFSEKFR